MTRASPAQRLPGCGPRWPRRWTVRLVAIACLMVAVALLAAANFFLVELRLIVWTGEVRLSWVLLGAGFVGFLLGLIAPRLPR